MNGIVIASLIFKFDLSNNKVLNLCLKKLFSINYLTIFTFFTFSKNIAKKFPTSEAIKVSDSHYLVALETPNSLEIFSTSDSVLMRKKDNWVLTL